MWCGKCENEPCVCVKPLEAQPVIRDTSTPPPANTLTKEEFGLDLFEAIQCCGSILQLRQLREHTPPAKIKPKQLHFWQLKERELLEEAKRLFTQIPDEPAAQLARRYPFILA